MTYNTYTLGCGLRVIHRHSESPVVYCGYQINAGTRDEKPGEEGLAHFCEHITFKGTERRNALKIINTLENVGGELNAYTNKEETVYYAAVLKEHLPKAVDLLTDIVFHSIFPQTEVEKEKEVICDEIESYNDSPAEQIYDEFENALFCNHPLGHNILGTAERVRSYTSDNAQRFTGKFYTPQNAVFFLYGNIDFQRLIRLLERATSDFAAAQPICLDIAPADISPYKAQDIELRHGTHQAHVMLGNRAFRVGDARRMPLYLLNNILGGPGMNARLNLSLRERHGLVYTVESSMTSYSDTGIWAVYFGCDPHDVNRCLRLVRQELDKMMEKPLTATRLSSAKRQIKGQIGIACDNRESRALDFGKTFLHYGWAKDIESLYSSIDAITAEEIQQVAREVFNPDNITLLKII